MILDDVLVITTVTLAFEDQYFEFFLALSLSWDVLRICIPAGQTYYADFYFIL